MLQHMERANGTSPGAPRSLVGTSVVVIILIVVLVVLVMVLVLVLVLVLVVVMVMVLVVLVVLVVVVVVRWWVMVMVMVIGSDWSSAHHHCFGQISISSIPSTDIQWWQETLQGDPT